MQQMYLAVHDNQKSSTGFDITIFLSITNTSINDNMYSLHYSKI